MMHFAMTNSFRTAKGAVGSLPCRSVPAVR